MSITLQDRVYFGAFWQILQATSDGAPIPLGGGFENAQVIRSADGLFFAGVIEKRNAAGQVTDVILTFAGAQGGADVLQGESVLLGAPLGEAQQAAALFDQLMADPAYASAKIHVTGHSLGAGYTQFVLAHALAEYGTAATDARADFSTFGSPNWGVASANYFDIDPALLDSRYATYVSENDPVRINGVQVVGTQYLLPAFDALLPGLNEVASHWPTTYALALGLPDWLSQQARDQVFAEVDRQFDTGSANDPNYGAPGAVGMTIIGSAEADVIQGLGGADVIRAGNGADFISGGGGADLFRFDRTSEANGDRILDFQTGDRIDLSRIDARADRLFHQDFDFIGEAAFSQSGQVRSWLEGNVTWVAGNTDADSDPEFLIRIDGRHHLTFDDFLL